MPDAEYFTVEGDLLAIVAAATGEDTAQRAPVTGSVRFEQVAKSGETYRAGGLTPRKAALVPYADVAEFDENGQLTYKGETGIKLLANTSVIGLSELYYKATFLDLRVNGFRTNISPAYIPAPTESTVLNLADYVNLPGGKSAVGIIDVPPVLHGGNAFETGDPVGGGGA